MYLITWITTHLPTSEGWMAEHAALYNIIQGSRATGINTKSTNTTTVLSTRLAETATNKQTLCVKVTSEQNPRQPLNAKLTQR